MLFYRFLILFFISCICLTVVAKPQLVDLDSFQPGHSWTWSYSEQTEISSPWQDPYLFETYSVVDRQGSLVTIDISSHADRGGNLAPHHRFIVDLTDCMNAKNSLGRLLRWKIKFYTKTRSIDWQLVSRKHDSLAFTEKFNCYDGPIPFKEIQNRIVGETRDIAKWLSIPLQSFYIADDSALAGVAAQRRSRNYLMLLDSVDLN